MEMNRRQFIIGAAVFPVAISLPMLVHEDPYDRFLRELWEQTVRRLNGRKLEYLWIEPVRDSRRLVHLFASGDELTWYQNYGG
jgi:hypothetical protein